MFWGAGLRVTSRWEEELGSSTFWGFFFIEFWNLGSFQQLWSDNIPKNYQRKIKLLVKPPSPPHTQKGPGSSREDYIPKIKFRRILLSQKKLNCAVQLHIQALNINPFYIKI